MKSSPKLFLLIAFTAAFCYMGVLNVYASQAPTKLIATSKDGKFQYEILGENVANPLLILLHGASGPGMGLYREQAEYFAANGYMVFLPHYFDATKSSSPTAENYHAWVNVVKTLLSEPNVMVSSGRRKVVLVGYSLGASVALAAGSQGIAVNAIAEWYGSLPDDFFYHIQGMPPLLILHGERDSTIPVMNAEQLMKLCEIKHFTCENHVYAGQGHGFLGNDLKDADLRTLAFFSRFTK